MSTWIDLTDLLEWKGNLTGIQRIQFNISKLYAESGDDVRFFTYHSLSRRFTEVSFDPDTIVRSGIVRTNKQRRSIYRGVLRRIHLLNTEIRIRNKVISASHTVRRKMLTKTTLPFTEHDTVLVMGSIWLGHFAEDLAEAKVTNRFRLIHFAFDMIPSVLPGFVVPWLPKVFTKYYKKAFAISDGIIAISESTAEDVRDFMKKHKIENKPRVEIIRIGESIDDSRSRPVKGLDAGFILSVSTIEARKNHAALLYVVREAYARGVKIPHIVIAGRRGWHTGDFLYIVENDPIVSKAITILDGPDDAQLTWLYKNCLYTIFPSFYEGWGMPVAESLAYGKMCIASNTSSLTEIAPEIVDHFSPYDTGELLEKIMLYSDKKLLKSKEALIKKTYRPTTWDDMYDKVRLFADNISR